MAFANGGSIVNSGLVLALDAADRNSYPGSGTTWNDVSENNNSGSLVNGPTFDSANGGSIVFDGTNDYILTPLQNIDRPCTFSIWVNLSSLASFQTFFGQDTSTAIPRGRFYFQKPGSTADGFITNVVNFSNVLSNGNIVVTNANNVIQINKWYNYVVSLTTTTISLYENGVLQNTTNDSNSFLTPNTKILINAGYYLDTIVDYVNGKTSSTQIYNRALSAPEILQNYNAQKSRFGL
jgi:hypothetical protein